jgi:hypothetical protein
VSRANTIAAQEETRLALASAAARTERQNQPRVLLFAAGLLLLIALIFVGVAFQGSLAASSDLRSQRLQTDDVIKRAGRYKALREAGSSDAAIIHPQQNQLVSRIQGAGVDAGLKNPVPLYTAKREEKPPGMGAKQTRYDFDVKDEELPKLLLWVQKATASVPGLELYSITLKPEAHQWSLRATFSIWEKIEGTSP